MVKLKTIVVDDESLARQLTLSCLQEFPEIEVLAECANGREAVKAVLALEPDLMFLDIRMPGLNGFEVIKKIEMSLQALQTKLQCLQKEENRTASNIHKVFTSSIPIIQNKITQSHQTLEVTQH